MWQNSNTQIVTTLKNSKYMTTQKLKLWQLKNSNCDETQKHKLWQNSNCDRTLKLKLWKNSNLNFDNPKTQIVTTQKLKLWRNSKTQIVTKLKNSNCAGKKNSNLKFWPLKISNCDKTQNSNCGKTQKLKLWQNSKTQIVTKQNKK